MKKRILSVLCMLCLLVGLVPTAAWAANGTMVSDGAELKAAVLNHGSYYLENDITLGSTLVIDKSITLDLNGHGLALSSEAAIDETQGSVIKITTGGELTLNDTGSQTVTYWKKESYTDLWAEPSLTKHEGVEEITTRGGYITGGKGIYIEETGNSVKYNFGAGVYVDGGTLILNGGTIVGNGYDKGNWRCGGGVYVKDGTFTMNGGAIVGNDIDLISSSVLTYGGGVYLDGGTFTMTDGTIRENKVDHGGGVDVKSGTFTMKGGVISKNTGLSSGGGVCVNGGTFDMQGGTISENCADGSWSYGGGVQVNKDGTFNMSAGNITGNTAEGSNSSSDTQGGGVCVWGSFKMTGGTISGNWVSGCNEGHIGGGVCVYAGSANTNGTISVSGSAKIINNLKGGTKGEDGEYIGAEDNNLYLNGVKIAIGGALTDEAKIGVRTDTNGFVMIIEFWKTYMEGKDPTDYFTSDDKNLMVKLSANKVYLDEHEHRWAYANDGADTIKATCSVDGCPSPNGGKVTIAAPDDLEYDGALKGVDLKKSSWQGQTVKVGDVIYKKENVTLDSTPMDVGTYTASLELGDVTASVTYTVTPKSVVGTVTVNAEQDLAYTGKAITPAVTVKDGETIISANNYELVYSNNINVGEATVTLSAKEGANYTVSGSTTFDITKASVVVTPNSEQAKTYGEDDPEALTYTTNLTGDRATAFANAVTGKLSRVAGEDASNYAITLGDLSAGDNFDISLSATTVNFTINQKNVTVSGVAVQDKEYDGTTTAVLDSTVPITINGLIEGDEVNLVMGTAAFADKKVGVDKAVTFTGCELSGEKAGNYKLAEQPTATADIIQKYVTISNLAATNRAYEKNNVRVELSGGTVNGAVEGDDVSVDVATAVGEVSTARVEVGKRVTVSGLKLKGADAANYKIYTMPIDVTVTITKADALTLEDITVSHKYNISGEQTLQIVNSMPTDAGTLTYAKGSSSVVGSATVSAFSVDNNGLVKYTIANGAVDDVITLPVVISSDNYADSTRNIKITLIAKTAQATLTIDCADSVIYGGTLELGVSGGNGTGAVTYAIVAGGDGEATIEGNVLTPTKAGTVKVQATKAGDDDYSEVTSQIKEITINKAAATGAPKYTKITAKNKTLADAALTVEGATFSPAEGTLKWIDSDSGEVLPDSTIVEKDAEYMWRFTPTDTNYNALTGTIKLYRASSGGGGGGGTHNTATYSVVVEAAKNGKVSADTNVAKGETVTVKVTPEQGYALDSLTVTDKSGKEITLTKVNDGKYTFTMPASKVTVRASFKAEAVDEKPTEEKPAESKPAHKEFTDVPAGAYYANAVDWAANKGITEGVTETTFSPNTSCTRAQMVTFLWRAAGSPEPTTTKCQFADVDMNSYYGKAVLWAVEQGIAKGITDTSFGPNAACSRAQMVTFICRLAGGKSANIINTFADVPADAYYAEAIRWAVENGIAKGMDDNNFSPDTTCVRAQMVTVLYRYFGE